MKIPSSLTSRFSRQIFVVRKNSPQILFAGGISAGVASTVLACKATLRLETKLSSTQIDLTSARTAIQVVREGGELHDTDGNIVDYDEKTYKNDVAKIYAKGVAELIQLYAPAIGMGVVSVAMLTKSQHILHERNAGLAAAYAAVDKAFARYRERVVAEHGEDKDLEYMHGVDESEIINPETNRKKKVKHFDGAGEPSMYAKFFDETNANFRRDPDWNLTFLTGVQNYANDRLRAHEYVFLNDVYESLGIPRTRAGSQVGWIKDEGDGHIDFGIYEGTTQTSRDFVNGREGAVLLDFNVDGIIWDRIPEHGETNWLGLK